MNLEEVTKIRVRIKALQLQVDTANSIMEKAELMDEIEDLKIQVGDFERKVRDINDDLDCENCSG